MRSRRASRNGSSGGCEVVDGVQCLQSVVADALAAFQTEATEKVSSITRKRRQEKSLTDLAAALEKADGVVKNVTMLSEARQATEQKLETAENGRIEAVERVSELMRELENSVVTIRETQAAKLASEKERNTLRCKLEELESANQALTETLNEREFALEASVKGATDRLDRAQALETTHDALKQELQTAQAELQSTRDTLLATQQSESAKAENYQRQNNVIAKLTADNVMKLIQLKEQAASLQLYKQDVEALRAEIETKRGPWFDEIRSNVEEQLRGSFEECEQLRRALEQRQTQHAAEIAATENRMHYAKEEADSLRHALERMKEDANASEDRESMLQESVSASKTEHERLNQALYAAQAELKISSSALASLREELSGTWVKYKDTEDAVQRQESSLATLQAEKRQLEAQLQQCQEKQRQQERVNLELMKRKEQVEWELVEARSVLPSTVAELAITSG